MVWLWSLDEMVSRGLDSGQPQADKPAGDKTGAGGE